MIDVPDVTLDTANKEFRIAAETLADPVSFRRITRGCACGSPSVA